MSAPRAASCRAAELVRRFELTFGGIDGPDVLPVDRAVVSIRCFDFG
jgi:hypothetical protein